MCDVLWILFIGLVNCLWVEDYQFKILNPSLHSVLNVCFESKLSKDFGVIMLLKRCEGVAIHYCTCLPNANYYCLVKQAAHQASLLAFNYYFTPLQGLASVCLTQAVQLQDFTDRNENC